MSGDRLDVRRMLLMRGWEETKLGLLRKGRVTVAYMSDVFVTGPPRGGRLRNTTISFGSFTPAAVVVAACEAWAETVTAPDPKTAWAELGCLGTRPPGTCDCVACTAIAATENVGPS